jgi:uncharacterized protein YhfF
MTGLNLDDLPRAEFAFPGPLRDRLGDVDLQHAVDEGEGDESVAHWRAGHESFWQSAEVRAELGDPSFTVNDDTLVLAQRFRVVDAPAVR